ncbi:MULTISPECIES: GNAT family N-acetyltransferase [Leptospira]|uniref:Acetyltransferase (GNAT) domain protein n=5 Tax=Leptospira borgpetersenii TaxID=174 RepID=M3HQY5_LEPBO|nr:acetyltransferase (GNAT) domain protein [Leptospira borgpetersenii serovar Ballum]ANH00939.1 Acetyltransferase (GNAT) domain protein [Leptospira borgpetersenii str. 4E]AXX14635.1 N-acetyltransferase [Leptospira borgpetersenii serovar Ceylonica]EKP14142.1 acetyltransferase (GNAT) domain protein [Leptospira borgpetersenii str. 200801926]EKQ92079.1 acetyltransferase (GNAT) domain protein [Leptospira borgpetersenii str. UI 09149]EKR01867.1 acetyltransferase (GNAT) domain protein [Leptospira bor
MFLREWEDGDIESFDQISSDPIVMEYFPALLSKNHSERFFEKMKTHFAEFGYGLWALETKQTKEWVGFTGFLNVTFYASFTPAVEIGWKLNSSFWNRGYATEAASFCLHCGFEQCKLSKMVLLTSIKNARS